MPNRKHDTHASLRALPGALRARMDSLGHDQLDVEAVTGVPQPQISRALNGVRKRLTPPMRQLCQYAGLDDNSPPAKAAAQELAALVQHMIGDSNAAAVHMKAVLRSLAPLMANCRRQGP